MRTPQRSSLARLSLVFVLGAAACVGGADAASSSFLGADPVAQRTQALTLNRADLVGNITGPSTGQVGTAATFTVSVENIGNRPASGTIIYVTVPSQAAITATTGGCVVAASPWRVRCPYGALGAGQSRTGTFTVTLPSAAATYNFTAQAYTSSAERSTTNNTVNLPVTTTPVPPPPPPPPPPTPVVIAPPQLLDIEDCFGPGVPTSFAQCTPAWMLTGQVSLDPGGLISVASEPDIAGTWSEPGGSGTIRMEYRTISTGDLISVFTGTSVSSTCYEGIITATVAPNGAFRACLH